MSICGLLALSRAFASLGVAQLAICVAAHAQPCAADWTPGFTLPFLPSQAGDLEMYDAGSGLEVFGTLGIMGANRVVRWVDSEWVRFGSEFAGAPRRLLPATIAGAQSLFVCGEFTAAGTLSANRIARWDGAQWVPLGSGCNNWVLCMAVWDDGTGPALFVGGSFTSAGGVPALRVAKWDGANWTNLGAGMTGSASGGGATVVSMAAFDDGQGSKLYVSGDFLMAGGQSAPYLARWDGTTWTSMSSGLNKYASDLQVFEGKLYACGGFAKKVAVLQAGSWQQVGPAIIGTAAELEVADLGAGPTLLLSGDFVQVGAVYLGDIVRWDGTTWASIGAGTDSGVGAMLPYQDQSGTKLIVSGSFTRIYQGGQSVSVEKCARLQGDQWAPLPSRSLNGPVNVLAVSDFDGPLSLYVGGEFSHAGVTSSRGIARWQGSQWHSVGGGVSGNVVTIAEHDDGSGRCLFVGGRLSAAGGLPAACVAKWNGVAWAPLGGGLSGSVPSECNALAVFDDGTGLALYAGGAFAMAGGVPVSNLAKWDGQSWTDVGGGANDRVRAMCVHDDGSGRALYVAGDFTSAGTTPARRVARWNGTQWSTLANGFSTNSVEALATFDDGAGPELYAAGNFDSAFGVSNSHSIARWDGQAWHALGSGIQNFVAVNGLGAHDDGNGRALYAVGPFGASFGIQAQGIARWRNGLWTTVSGGIRPYAPSPAVSSKWAAVSYDDGSQARSLYVGGQFTYVKADALESQNIARYGCQPCYANCDNSTAAPILNVNDFICFQSKFASGDPYANCDNSTAAPVLNINDFICFQSKFAAGCP